MFEGDVDEAEEGWVAEDASVLDLAFEHFGVVVVDNVADGLVPGVVGLDDDLALVAVATCAAANLGHLLECPFEGAEVGEIDEIVGGEDSDDADVVEVEAFGDHLGAYEDVDFAFLEVGEEFGVVVLLEGAVEVHTSDVCFGEEDGEVVLDALSAEPFHREVVGVAGGAFCG